MPNGIRGTRFFQKHAHRQPPFVKTVQLTAKVAGEQHEYVVCNNLASLLWLGQLGSLELHASYARVSPEPDALELVRGVRSEEVADRLFDYPDFLVFDLDPYIYAGSEREGEEPVLNRPAFQKTAEIALRLKELLDGLGLESFVKTTGKTGLHIFAPILRTADYTIVRAVAVELASRLVERYPNDVTMEWDIEKRSGKVFLDVNQNVRAKTVAAIFSTRGVQQAAVSMPLRWDEVARVYPTDFTIRSAVARLAREGDPWAGILDAKQVLPAELSSMPRAS
jgi:bifunctional non-homologous end joining protein LigD